jgi:hypothetical protein
MSTKSISDLLTNDRGAKPQYRRHRNDQRAAADAKVDDCGEIACQHEW